jgi:hypothetical protein
MTKGAQWGWVDVTISHHFQDHQAAGYDFHPAPPVFRLGNKTVPEGLGVVLLLVQDKRRDVLSDMACDVVAQHKGHGLALVNVHMGNQSFPEHAFSLDLAEIDGRAGVVVVILLQSHIQLKLNIFAVEGGHGALFRSGRMTFTQQCRRMLISRIVEGGEDFNIWCRRQL